MNTPFILLCGLGVWWLLLTWFVLRSYHERVEEAKIPFAWLFRSRGMTSGSLILGAYVAVYTLLSLLGHYQNNIESLDQLGIITRGVPDRWEWQPLFMITTRSQKREQMMRSLLLRRVTDYNCSVVIAAPAAAVHAALTTREGLQGWWTKTCEVGATVGTYSTFRFGETHNKMRIERLQPCEIRWQCVEQHHDAPGQLKRPDEWVGTTLVFRLLPQTPAKTLLEFEHLGLRPELECYAICQKGWNHFLRRSLRSYLESGKGEPYV